MLKKKKTLKFWNQIFRTVEGKVNLYLNDGGGAMSGEVKEQLMSQSTTSCIKHLGGSVKRCECMAASRTGSLLFIDGVTVDRS